MAPTKRSLPAEPQIRRRPPGASSRELLSAPRTPSHPPPRRGTRGSVHPAPGRSPQPGAGPPGAEAGATVPATAAGGARRPRRLSPAPAQGSRAKPSCNHRRPLGGCGAAINTRRRTAPYRRAGCAAPPPPGPPLARSAPAGRACGPLLPPRAPRASCRGRRGPGPRGDGGRCGELRARGVGGGAVGESGGAAERSVPGAAGDRGAAERSVRGEEGGWEDVAEDSAAGGGGSRGLEGAREVGEEGEGDRSVSRPPNVGLSTGAEM